MTKKKYLFILILIISIGFATITTALLLNGSIRIGANTAFDGEVIFIDTDWDETSNAGDIIISADGKTVTADTGNLIAKSDERKLVFTIKNNSYQYTADAVLSCEVSDELKDYIDISYGTQGNAFNIPTQSTVEGSVKLTLKKSVINGLNGNFTCTINASASENSSDPTPNPGTSGN